MRAEGPQNTPCGASEEHEKTRGRTEISKLNIPVLICSGWNLVCRVEAKMARSLQLCRQVTDREGMMGRSVLTGLTSHNTPVPYMVRGC
jgi:hypothetical protein